MNNPKISLYIGYVMLVCGIIISILRLAQILNLFGLSRTDSSSGTTFVGLLFILVGIVNIKKHKRKSNE